MADPAPSPTGPDDSLGAAGPRSDRVLFAERGGSWWVVLIGPVLIAAVVAVEAAGPGSVHWPVLSIFLVILVGFPVLQVTAARRHVSVELTDTHLRQGAQTISVADIATIYPENLDDQPQRWQSAPALGELSGVPRRRSGIGVELTSGSLAQAWARDHARLRAELTDAHLAMRMGLPPWTPRHDEPDEEPADGSVDDRDEPGER